MSAGWICPKCGAGVAPHVERCDHGVKDRGVAVKTDAIPDWIKREADRREKRPIKDRELDRPSGRSPWDLPYEPGNVWL